MAEYRRRSSAKWLLAVAVACAGKLPAQGPEALLRASPGHSSAAPGSLAEAKQSLAAKQFVRARAEFAAFERGHAGNVEAELGLADAELGLREDETAELEYRKVVAAQPEQWAAHKNLVVVEAALGRWGEFDRERALLRGARQRGAPGITARESDVIDSFDLGGSHWIVREYYEPVGRTLTRYNFERFSPDGRVQEYISLESKAAAEKILAPGHMQDAIRIGADDRGADDRGADDRGANGPGPAIRDFALNWYTGKAHGTIATFPRGEPAYEHVRSAVRSWLRIQH